MTQCPNCGTPLVPMGKVLCRTGDVRKVACCRCRGVWYDELSARLHDSPPLRETLERLARQARSSGLVELEVPDD